MVSSEARKQVMSNKHVSEKFDFIPKENNNSESS